MAVGVLLNISKTAEPAMHFASAVYQTKAETTEMTFHTPLISHDAIANTEINFKAKI